MIGLKDTLRLSYTKFQTRRTRMIITVVIASLLFSVLLFVSLVMRGTIKGVETLSKTGFGGRYMVSGSYTYDFNAKMGDADLIAKAKNIQKDITAKKVAEAKRLGVEYDPKNDFDQLVTSFQNGPGQPAIDQLNINSETVAKLILDNDPNRIVPLDAYKALAAKYNVKDVYVINHINYFKQAYLKVLVNNKESFEDIQLDGYNAPKGVSTLPQTWQLTSSKLMEPFLLPDQSIAIGNDKVVPVVAPYTAAEEILGLKALPSTATAKERLARLQEVRSKSAGFSFSVCYRNQTSVTDIDTARSDQQQLTANKNVKDYVKPSLIHDLPSQPCGATQVTRDVRTAEEKSDAAKQTQFNRTFGEVAPTSEIIKFRIVGINADYSFGGGSVIDIFSSILQSSLGGGWFSPREAAATYPVMATFFSDDNNSQVGSSAEYVAEFPSAEATKSFISNESCQPDISQQPAGVANYNPYFACNKAGKVFSLASFGSSATAINDMKKFVGKAILIAAAIIGTLAMIIMVGIVGRIIADSRRETAVFRAIGAKHTDISQIYHMYSFLISLAIAIVSTCIATVLASIVNNKYSEGVSINALIAYNARDLTYRVTMVGYNSRDLFIIIGLIMVAGLVGAAIPLLAAARRNPINDMRDDR